MPSEADDAGETVIDNAEPQLDAELGADAMNAAREAATEVAYDGGVDADAAVISASDAAARESGAELDASNDSSAADADAGVSAVAQTDAGDTDAARPLSVLCTDSVALVESTFATSDDGWRADELTYPAVGSAALSLGTYTPTRVAKMGSDDGYLRVADPAGNTLYWSAPSAFTSRLTGGYGGTLRVALAVTGAGYGNPPGFDQEDVVLVGGGLTLVADLDLAVAPNSVLSFRAASLPLREASFRRGSLSGALASEADLRAALGQTSKLYIRAEYLFGLDDVMFLDTAALCAP